MDSTISQKFRQGDTRIDEPPIGDKSMPSRLSHLDQLAHLGHVCIACVFFDPQGHLQGQCKLHKVTIPDGSDPKNACANWKAATFDYSLSDKIQVDITKIDQSSYTMRHIDETVVSDLALSIQTHGLLQPLMVRPKPDGRYEIVFGRHRLIACSRLGFKEVPCIVRAVDDTEATVIQITENIQRNVRLDPVQEGQFYSELHKQGLSTYAIGRKIGKSAVYVQDRISIQEKLDPSLKEKVSNGTINASIGHRLAELPSRRHQLQVVKSVGHRLTVANVERIVRGHADSPTRCDCRDCPTHGGMLKGGKTPPLDKLYFAGTWIRNKSNIEERRCIFCGHILKVGEHSFPLRYKGILTSYEACKPCTFARAPPDFQALYETLRTYQSPNKIAYPQATARLRPVCPVCVSNHYVQKNELQNTSSGQVQRYNCTRCQQRFALTIMKTSTQVDKAIQEDMNRP